MGMHESVTLTFKDQDYVIESERVMGLIEVVESVVTLDELIQHEKLRPAKISRAYTDALNYAGAGVKQGDVYASLFDSQSQSTITGVVTSLLMLMMPPEFITETGEVDTAPEPKKKKTKRKKKKGS